MNNVHEDAPTVFETRWAMSYLRGPLTRTQIKTLMASRSPKGERFPVAGFRVTAGESTPAWRPARYCHPKCRNISSRCEVQPRTAQCLLYQPALLGCAQIRFVEAKTQVDCPRDLTLLTAIDAGPVAVDWKNSSEAGFGVDELERESR